MSETREWTLTGGLFVYDRPGGPPGNRPHTHCEGPYVGIGELIHVIEHSAYDQLKAKCADYEWALETIIEPFKLDNSGDLMTDAETLDAVDDIAREVLAKYKEDK